MKKNMIMALVLCLWLPAFAQSDKGSSMQAKDPAVKTDNMSGMAMADKTAAGDPFQNARSKLGPVKTLVNNTPPRTVRYDLYMADTIVSFGGKPKRAIAVNGSIPMPTLTFTEGDTAEIYVHNNLKEESSLHWTEPQKLDEVRN